MIVFHFFRRLTGTPMDVYNYLEPILIDYRKLRYRRNDGRKCNLAIFILYITSFSRLLFFFI